SLQPTTCTIPSCFSTHGDRPSPTNLEAERIAVMLLSPRHILNRELWRGMGERRSQLLLIHDSLRSSCACESDRSAAIAISLGNTSPTFLASRSRRNPTLLRSSYSACSSHPGVGGSNSPNARVSVEGLFAISAARKEGGLVWITSRRSRLAIAGHERHRPNQSNPPSGPLRRPPRLPLHSLVQIPIGLQPHPQLRRRFQEPREPKRGIGGDAPLPENNLVQSVERNAKPLRRFELPEAERL